MAASSSPAPRARVIVVASVNIDLVVRVDRLPGPGETVTGGQFARHHGGKGGNQAVAAARLGAPTSFVGGVGDDPFGVAARDALIADGVDVTALATMPSEATGVALILVDAAGENSIAVAGGANAVLAPSHVEAAFARLRPVPGDVVIVGHEIPTVTARAALVAARRAGARTILNPAPADGLDETTLAAAEILTPNRGELSALAGSTGTVDDLAHALLAVAGDATDAVLVSLGADGARLVTRERTVALDAPRVSAVDTVGAGDALNGALAAGLAAGLELEAASRRAVAAASLAVTRVGAREGMPTADELRVAFPHLA